jgi:S1-C subfamily serine protease
MFKQILASLVMTVVLTGCSVMTSHEDPTEMIEDAKRGIVVIASESVTNMQTGEKGESGLGTGFFIDENTILTNAHVVNEAKNVKVALENSPGMYDATVKYADTSMDVAVLNIKDYDTFTKENDNIKILSLQEKYEIAEKVYTVGHAWGLFYSVSTGVISYEERKIDGDMSPRFLIQTDAKIYQGNSGGPMLNEDGEVLGINVIMLAQTGGSYGFTIPAKLVDKALNDFEEYNEVRWPTIGVVLEHNTISGFAPESAAETAGLKVGDKIISVKVNDKETTVKSAKDVVMALAVSDYQDNFVFTVQDLEGDEITLDITPTYKTKDDFRRIIEAEDKQ